MNNTRKLVLQSFKNLHRTRLKVFAGDMKALTAARLKINEEYCKNKHIQEEESIKAMIQFSVDVEKELKSHVIQAQEVEPGLFEAKITEDTLKLINVPFNNLALPEDGSAANSPTPCCRDQAKNK